MTEHIQEPYIPDFDNSDCGKCPKCGAKTLFASIFYQQMQCLNPFCNYTKKFTQEQIRNCRR